MGNLHDDVYLLLRPEFISFFSFIFKFGNPSEVWVTKALIWTSKRNQCKWPIEQYLSCAVSGFGQVLKSDPRDFAARVFDRPSAEHVSACGRRNEAPTRTREKTSGTQGNWAGVRKAGFECNSILEQKKWVLTAREWHSFKSKDVVTFFFYNSP